MKFRLKNRKILSFLPGWLSICAALLSAAVFSFVNFSGVSVTGCVLFLFFSFYLFEQLIQRLFEVPMTNPKFLGVTAAGIVCAVLLYIENSFSAALMSNLIFGIISVAFIACLYFVLSDRNKIFSAVITLLGLAVGWSYILRNLGQFSSDSYSYYDISRTFFSDFGQVNTIRQYVIRSDYNCSFPYLYPLFIRIVDDITQLKIYAGVFFNVLLMPITAIVFLYISKRFTKSSLCGAIVSFLLFTNEEYLTEVYAGRSIPLVIIFTAAAISLSCKLYLDGSSPLYVCLIGVLAGFNIMVRFDEIPLAAFLLPVIFLSASKGKRLKTTLLYTSCTALPILPWCVYSMKHFERLFFSDNNGTALMLEAQVPSYVLLPEDAYENIWNMPSQWLLSFLEKFYKTFHAVGTMAIPMIHMLGVFLIFGICVFIKTRRADKNDKALLSDIFHIKGKPLHILLAISLYTTARLIMYSLVGYIEYRYYVEPIMICFFLIIMLLYNRFHDYYRKYFKILVFAFLLFLLQTSNMFFIGFCSEIPTQLNIYHSKPWLAELDTALQSCSLSKNDSILMVGYQMNGFVFGALTDWKTYVSPENLSPETVEYVLQNYADADWIAVDGMADYSLRSYFAQRYQENEFESFYLYQINAGD